MKQNVELLTSMTILQVDGHSKSISFPVGVGFLRSTLHPTYF